MQNTPNCRAQDYSNTDIHGHIHAPHPYPPWVSLSLPGAGITRASTGRSGYPTRVYGIPPRGTRTTPRGYRECGVWVSPIRIRGMRDIGLDHASTRAKVTTLWGYALVIVTMTISGEDCLLGQLTNIDSQVHKLTPQHPPPLIRPIRTRVPTRGQVPAHAHTRTRPCMGRGGSPSGPKAGPGRGCAHGHDHRDASHGGLRPPCQAVGENRLVSHMLRHW